MGGKSREELLAALVEAIGLAETEWRKDPEHSALLAQFRAFAAVHDPGVAAPIDQISPTVRERFKGSRIPQLLRLIGELGVVEYTPGPTTATRERLTAELAQAERTLAALEQHKTLIQQRFGPYADCVRRLRAERALRELPATIARLRKALADVTPGCSPQD